MAISTPYVTVDSSGVYSAGRWVTVTQLKGVQGVNSAGVWVTVTQLKGLLCKESTVPGYG